MFFIVFCFIIGQSCFAINTYDLAVYSADIYLSKDDVYVGDSVRVYARIHNLGTKDVSSYVYFYQGNQLIGESQYVSSVAGGENEEVWVDNWVPTQGSYNIRVKIDKTLLVNNVATGGKDEYVDQDTSNNEALSKLIYVCVDTDGDEICNIDDDDDDNDGLKDIQEDKNGNEKVDSGETDPLDPDTDDDGYIDSQDDCPLDPNGHIDSNHDGICGNERQTPTAPSTTTPSTPDAQPINNDESNGNEDSNNGTNTVLSDENTENLEENSQDKSETAESENIQEESASDEESENIELPAFLQKFKKDNNLENMSLSAQFMDWWKLVNILISMIVLLLIGAIALYYIGLKKKDENKSQDEADKKSELKTEKREEGKKEEEETEKEDDGEFEEF